MKTNTFKKKTLFVLASTILTFGLWAQDSSADFDALSGESGKSTDANTEKSGSTLTIQGEHEFDFHLPVYGDNLDFNSQAKEPAFVNFLGLEYKSGEVKAVVQGKTKTLTDKSLWTSMTEFRPGEAWISWNPSQFKLSFGYQEFSWGVADKKNPTDSLNPHDFVDGLDAPKIPVLAGNAVWYPIDWLSLEAVYVPHKNADLFPKDFATTTAANLVSFGTTVKTVLPEETVRSAVAGTRANLFLKGADLSFSYLYDWDTFYTPVIVLTNGPTYTPTSIDLVKKRIHRLGVNAKTTIDKFGLWFEGAYNVTEDPTGTDDSIRNNKLAWTAGFDFNYGPGDLDYVNVQYVGEWIPGFDQATAKDYQANPTVPQLMDKSYMQKRLYRSLTQSLGSETEELLQGVTLNLKWPLADSLVVPSLSGGYLFPLGYDDTAATRYGALILKPEVDIMPVDSFHILVGADLRYAWVKKAGKDQVELDATTDKIGVYTPDNNVYVKFNYKWNMEVTH